MSSEATIIEKQFDLFFKSINYNRIDEELDSKSPNFNNCDYISRSKNILIELKIIEKDYFSNGGIMPQLNAFVTKPMDIDENGVGFYNIEINRNSKGEAIGNIDEPLKRLLKKSNRQLKETKAYLKLENNSKGVLIIALNFQITVNPLFIRDTCFKYLEKDFSSIHSIIVLTPKYGLNIGTEYIACTAVGFEEEASNDQLFLENVKEISDLWLEFEYKGGHKN